MNAAILQEILELARWAPSGDNTQVWRFELTGPDSVAVHFRDTRADTVYDLDGHPSQISWGALLETMSIAASKHHLRANISRRGGVAEDGNPVFDVQFVPDAAVEPSPLLDAISLRSVQRRPMHTRPLSSQEKVALEASTGAAYAVQWIEGRSNKLRTAKLMYDNARLRLSMPEAYEVHKRIIHWGASHSPDRVPDQALGVDAMTLKLMKWAMHSWGRLSLMNKVMGTWAPRLQMDMLPGIACAAHFVLRPQQPHETIEDWVAAGRALQRFWLTATMLGLQLQPELTPLIFSSYVRKGIRFSRVDALQDMAERLLVQLEKVIGNQGGQPVFMGRIGAGPAAQARSTRRPLSELMK